MSSFLTNRSFIYVAGNLIDAAQNNQNENNIFTAHNNSHDATAGHTHDGAVGNGTVLTTMPTLVPIGTIIPFYDFNGGLTFNSTYWAYCNGQVKNVGALVGQTLPDLSNRYLVGFGTEGGGDIGSAAWATAAVGNASHQISLAHTHTVASHTHTTPAHAHTLSAHTHTGASGTTSSDGTGSTSGTSNGHTHTGAAGTTSSDGTGSTSGTSNGHTHSTPDHIHGLYPNTPTTAAAAGTLIGYNAALGNMATYTAGSSTFFYPMSSPATESGGASTTGTESLGHSHTGPAHTHTVTTGETGTESLGHSHTGPAHTHTVTTGATGGPSSDSTDSSGASTSGGTVATMDSQLSATQSIQTRSVRCRYLMRIL